MPAQQTIALLGAPGTGAPALAEALQHRLADSAMTAQEIAVADAPQLPTAIRHTLHSAAITLLMGLDLPCAAPEQAPREACEAHRGARRSAAVTSDNSPGAKAVREIPSADDLHAELGEL